MNINEIQDLIKFVSKSGVSEVEIEQKDFKIIIKSDPLPKKRGKGNLEMEKMPAQMMMPTHIPTMPQVQMAPPPVAVPVETPAKPAKEDASDLITIKSPMIGTFYRSPGPDKPPFISVGDDVSPGKVICIVEAMKLFNEIEAEVSGKIVKVLIDDASPVEYDQPLFLVKPA